MDNSKPLSSFNMARLVFLAISLVALAYHGLILSGLVDYRYAWGGRLPDRAAMFRMEGISVALQLAFMALVAFAVPRAGGRASRVVLGAVLAAMALLFLLNTVGNLAAVSAFEKWAFTPLTFIAALCCGRMALGLLRKPAA
ncbi:MAG: hypothetical protein J0L75_20945 [Spirochaetes bacterium]|nr:hypothetical protein [Spirochaetota bacterium]